MRQLARQTMMFRRQATTTNAIGMMTRHMSTAPFKLYGFPMSQPVRSVLLLCHSADIKYDFVLVDAHQGHHVRPDFRKIHPPGLLPAIEEEGLGVLGECSAILQYLAETRKLEKWYPTNPLVRARVNYWMSWHHTNTRVCTSGLIRIKLFPPRDGTGEAMIAKALKQVQKSLTQLDEHLKTNKFLAPGDAPTIADLLLLPELDQHTPEAFGMIDFAPFPNIQRWMKDMISSCPTYPEVFASVIEKAKASSAMKK